jgi:hypothetical protein
MDRFRGRGLNFNFYLTPRPLLQSCAPNCETQKWRDPQTNETRVGLFTTTAVRKGVELTYDYCFNHFGSSSALSFTCKCGAVPSHPILRRGGGEAPTGADKVHELPLRSNTRCGVLQGRRRAGAHWMLTRSDTRTMDATWRCCGMTGPTTRGW